MPVRKAAAKRRRARRPSEAISLETALEILELLGTRPAGLTVLEVASLLRHPAAEVISTIGIMQRRQWLCVGAHHGGLVLGPRVIELTQGRC
jgi:DNA-binding IclR family transcriptional regulator